MNDFTYEELYDLSTRLQREKDAKKFTQFFTELAEKPLTAETLQGIWYMGMLDAIRSQETDRRLHPERYQAVAS